MEVEKITYGALSHNFSKSKIDKLLSPLSISLIYKNKSLDLVTSTFSQVDFIF